MSWCAPNRPNGRGGVLALPESTPGGEGWVRSLLLKEKREIFWLPSGVASEVVEGR